MNSQGLRRRYKGEIICHHQGVQKGIPNHSGEKVEERIAVSIQQDAHGLFAFVTIAAILAASRIVPGPELAWLPLIVIVQTLFHVVIGLIMAYLAAFVRDLQRILGHFTRIMRFTAPVIFEADRIPKNFEWMLDYNPFAWLVMAYRDVLMYGRVPPIDRIVYLGVASLLLSFLLLIFYTLSEHRVIKVL